LVARWVRERRLENCRRDLGDPALADLSVIAIAGHRGFDDAAHFSKIFKATYGAPPGQYRRQVADTASQRGAQAARARQCAEVRSPGGPGGSGG
jgi:transcriptional regulator GlxA family with amidase domain